MISLDLYQNPDTRFCYHDEGGILVLDRSAKCPLDRPCFLMPSTASHQGWAIYLTDHGHHGMRGKYQINIPMIRRGSWLRFDYAVYQKIVMGFEDRRDAITFELMYL
jgi:hypothetical protein